MNCALTNHIMACHFCNGMHAKYCHEGRRLWVEDAAAWIAGRPDSEQRRAEYRRIAQESPIFAESIKKRVAELVGDAAQNTTEGCNHANDRAGAPAIL